MLRSETSLMSVFKRSNFIGFYTLFSGVLKFLPLRHMMLCVTQRKLNLKGSVEYSPNLMLPLRHLVSVLMCTETSPPVSSARVGKIKAVALPEAGKHCAEVAVHVRLQTEACGKRRLQARRGRSLDKGLSFIIP